MMCKENRSNWVMALLVFAGLLGQWTGVLAQSGMVPVLEMSSDLVSIQFSGAFTTSDGSGSLTVVDPGTVHAPAANGTLVLRPNRAKDVMLSGLLSDQDPNDMVEWMGLVKRPSSLSVGDLAGGWTLVELYIEQWSGRNAVEPQLDVLPLQVAADGGFSVPDGALRFEVIGGNRLQVDVGIPLYFDINASKTFMLGMHQEVVSPELTSYVIRCVIRDGSPVMNDLAGTWHEMGLSIESFFDRDYSYFALTEGAASVNSSGSYTGGSFSLTGGGGVEHSPSGKASRLLTMSSAGDILVGGWNDPEGRLNQLELHMKRPTQLAAGDLAGDWSFWSLGVMNYQDGDALTVETYYGGGAVRERYEAQVQKGVETRHGPYTSFFEDGTIEIQATYSEGQLDGIYQLFDPSAVLQERAHYTAGQYNGSVELFYPDGALMESSEYSMGIRDGAMRFFSPEGDLLEEQIYALGIPTSRSYFSYELGSLSVATVESYAGGVLTTTVGTYYRQDSSRESETTIDHTVVPEERVTRSYYADGTTLHEVYRWVGDRLEGLQETYYENGQNASLAPYVEGRLHGTEKTWNSLGFITRETGWVYGRRHGPDRTYDLIDAGSLRNELIHQTVYEYGVVTDEFRQTFAGSLLSSQYWSSYDPGAERQTAVSFHANGVTNWVNTYLNGEADGEQLSYYDNGQLATREFFVMGSREGSHTTFFDNGQLETEQVYTNDLKQAVWTTYTSAGELLSETTWNLGRQDGSEKAWEIRAGVRVPKLEADYEADVLISSKTFYYASEGGASGEYVPTPDLTGIYEVEYGDWGQDSTYRQYHPGGVPLLLHEEQLNSAYHGMVTNFWDWVELPHETDGEGNPIEPTQHHPAFGSIREISAWEHGIRQGTHRRYDTNGWPLILSTYDRDKLDGAYTEYFAERTLDAQGVPSASPVVSRSAEYTQGEMDGEERVYHWNGQLLTLTTWVMGVKSGPFESYRSDGSRQESSNYDNGLLTGWHRTYFSSGELQSEEHYERGVRNGLGKVYSAQSGLLLSQHTYVEDVLNGPFTTFDSNGSKTSEGDYADGFLEGTVTSYGAGGRTVTTYRRGLKHGNETQYDAENRVTSVTPYALGRKHGLELSYSQGSKTAEVPYVDGLIHGTTRRYHSNGALYASTMFQQGKAHGAHREYASQGWLMLEGQYSNGQKCGTWLAYQRNVSGALVDTIPTSHGSCGVLEPSVPPDVYANCQLNVTLLDTDGLPVQGYWSAEGTTSSGDPISYSGGTSVSGVGGTTLYTKDDLDLVVSASASGYRATTDQSVMLSPEEPFAALNFTLTRLDGPAITGVQTTYGDHFMHGQTLHVPYVVSINWGEATPGALETYVNGVQVGTYFAGGGQGGTFEGTVDMGTGLLKVDPGRSLSQIAFVARSAEGLRSDPYNLKPVIYELPDWLRPLSHTAQVVTYEGSPYYRLSFLYPPKPLNLGLIGQLISPDLLATLKDIPLFGGGDLGLENIQFKYDLKIDTFGRGEVSGKAAIGTKFKMASGNEFILDPKASGSAQVGFRYAAGGGPFLTKGKIALDATTGIETEWSLLRILPFLSNYVDRPFVGKPIRILEGLAKFKGWVKPSLGVTMPFSQQESNGVQELVWDPHQGTFGTDVGVGLELKAGDLLALESRDQKNSMGIKGLRFEETVALGSKIDWDWTGASSDSSFFTSTEISYTAKVVLKAYTFDLGLEPVEIKWRYPEPVSPAGAGIGSAVGVGVHPMMTRFTERADYNTRPGLARQGTTGEQILLQNILPRSLHATARDGGNTAVIYTYLDPVDAVAQGTEIGLLWRSGAGNFQPMPFAADDQLAEFAPDIVFLPDGRLLGVWQRVKDPSLDGTDLGAYMGAMEIVWGIFDPASSSWSAISAVTENSFLDQEPRLLLAGAEIFLLWQSNPGNEWIGDALNPTQIYLARWNGNGFDPSASPSAGFVDAFDFDVAADSDRVRLAYAQDTDGDLSTATDKEIFYLDYLLVDPSDPLGPAPGWGESLQVTINATPDSQPRFARNASGAGSPDLLFWVNGADVVRLVDADLGLTSPVIGNGGFPVGAEYQVLDTGEDLMICWPDLNEGHPDIAARFDHGSGFSETVFLTRDAAQETDLLMLPGADGNYEIVFNRHQADPEQTDLVWLEYEDAVDLSVGPSGLSATAVDADSGAYTLTVEVVNAASTGVGEIDVALYEGDPAAGGSLVGTVTVWLDGADSGFATFDYTVPSPIVNDTLHAVIDPDNLVAETSEDNNTATLQLLRPNLKLSRATVIENETGSYEIGVEVLNSGLLATPATEVSLLLGGTSTESVPLGAMAPEAQVSVSFVVTPETLAAAGTGSLVLRVDPNDSIEESDEVDNDLSLILAIDSTPSEDSDQDGIPDSYEILYFGGLDRDGTGDLDADGATDLEEFLTATDPNDPGSVLEVGVTSGTGGLRTISWVVQPGVTYRLEVTGTADGGEGWLQLGSDITGAGATSSLQEIEDPDASASDRRFYRLRLIP